MSSKDIEDYFDISRGSLEKDNNIPLRRPEKLPPKEVVFKILMAKSRQIKEDIK